MSILTAIGQMLDGPFGPVVIDRWEGPTLGDIRAAQWETLPHCPGCLAPIAPEELTVIQTDLATGETAHLHPDCFSAAPETDTELLETCARAYGRAVK